MRHFLTDSLVFPSLNLYTYTANLRNCKDPDFLDYEPIIHTVYDGGRWKAALSELRYESYGNPYRASYNQLFTETYTRTCRSLSEIYSLQTFRKDFAELPAFASKKLKISAIEGFSLKESDVRGSRLTENEQDDQRADLDVQGALLNNPAQIGHVFDQVLAKTVQKGYLDSLIGIDVDKFLVEEFRESLLALKELNEQVRHES